ncbi:hypothetical protein CCACVL1_24951 [Corchorus capsularis]|uniref:F-box domain-containing protein n=1 Tax=Corchorus capsularis TaxID=210143 RepID=A0A1R3GMH7_COCAP|nr:hypothetical protein CCACVL1_24951 [Corchorus capsularis]
MRRGFKKPSIPFLPDEIISNILIRLPAEYLHCVVRANNKLSSVVDSRKAR